MAGTYQRETFLILTFLLFLVYPTQAYVATFNDGGTSGLYVNVDNSGIDITCVSINNGFQYLSSENLISDEFDYAYAGDYDYDFLHISDSGVWMMDDHIPGDVQSAYIEFSDDVYFEQIWFAQAGDDYPVQGDVAYVAAYAADSEGEYDWVYQASVNFDSSNDFNQWFCISPNAGLSNTPIRRLVLGYNNINYGVWDHLVFETDNLRTPGTPQIPEPTTLLLISVGTITVGILKRRNMFD